MIIVTRSQAPRNMTLSQSTISMSTQQSLLAPWGRHSGDGTWQFSSGWSTLSTSKDYWHFLHISTLLTTYSSPQALPGQALTHRGGDDRVLHVARRPLRVLPQPRVCPLRPHGRRSLRQSHEEKLVWQGKEYDSRAIYFSDFEFLVLLFSFSVGRVSKPTTGSPGSCECSGSRTSGWDSFCSGSITPSSSGAPSHTWDI